MSRRLYYQLCRKRLYFCPTRISTSTRLDTSEVRFKGGKYSPIHLEHNKSTLAPVHSHSQATLIGSSQKTFHGSDSLSTQSDSRPQHVSPRVPAVCEGLRKDVTHISLQMMPYPWWDTVQAKLHPGVVFPPILRGVSTKRNSEGNAVLITRFLAANLPLGRPIFLDMQAVNEREIGSAGAYRDFTLIPHGLTYRVLPKLTLRGTERWHEKSVQVLGR